MSSSEIQQVGKIKTKQNEMLQEEVLAGSIFHWGP